MHRVVAILLFLYAIGIVLFQVLPLGDMGLDRIGIGAFEPPHLFHAASFFPWGFLGALYVRLRPSGRFRRALGWLVLGLLLATAAEGVQYWVPYRSFTPTDLSFNLAGVLLGSPAMLIGFRGRRRGDSASVGGASGSDRAEVRQ